MSVVTLDNKDTNDYKPLKNKPRINNVELDGNKSASALKLNVIYENQSIVANGVTLTIYNT